MAPRRRATPPCFGCLFCSSRYTASDRVGQHLDEQLPEYCEVHNKPPPSPLYDPHPVSAIRAWRASTGRRASQSRPAVVLLPQTVTEPVGAGWKFIVPIETVAELQAYIARAPRTADQWLQHLGAIPIPVAPPVVEISDDESSSSSSDDDDDDLASPIRKRPRPEAAAPRVEIGRRTSHNSFTSNSISVGRITAETMDVNNLASNVATVTSGTPESPDPDCHTDDAAIAALRARWDVVPHTPLTRKSIARALNPTPANLNVQEFVDKRFTPGKGPTYFVLQIATTEFTVNVKKDTTLAGALGIVQRELLEREGWPEAVGLAGVDGVRWDEKVWGGFKAEARGKTVVAELVFAF